jgi:hypothetical protein
MPGENIMEEGRELALTFQNEAEYKICSQNINIYIANFVCNAIVKKVIRNENDSISILYGDTDSKPMYISCTGYKKADEAAEELKNIMNKKEMYINALTLNEYIIAEQSE